MNIINFAFGSLMFGELAGYSIKQDGTVYSFKRKGISILKPNVNKDGYLKLQLNKKHVLIHSLIAQEYLGPRPEGFVVRHLDGNPGNNHIDNLKYGTYKENRDDAVAFGSLRMKGKDNPKSKLTDEKVVEILELLKTKTYYQKDIARTYGVSQHTISLIKQGRLWTHIPR